MVHLKLNIDCEIETWKVEISSKPFYSENDFLWFYFQVKYTHGRKLRKLIPLKEFSFMFQFYVIIDAVLTKIYWMLYNISGRSNVIERMIVKFNWKLHEKCLIKKFKDPKKKVLAFKVSHPNLWCKPLTKKSKVK